VAREALLSGVSTHFSTTKAANGATHRHGSMKVGLFLASLNAVF